MNFRLALGDEYVRLEKEGKRVQKIENEFNAEIEKNLKRTITNAIEKSAQGFTPDFDIPWLKEVLERHALTTMIAAYEFAESKKPSTRKFSKPPSPKLPRTLKDLMKIWDSYQKKDNLLKRANKLYEQVRKQYLQKLETVWKVHGQDFLEGKTGNKEQAIDAIIKQGDTTIARAKTIIATETTYYQNKARVTYYNAVPEVTHYLFLAIRDKATTAWCAPRVTAGKRGRHGLVFEKGSELLKKNTAPCFLPGSQILTLQGWKNIECIGIADYVWTHKNRWRRVTKIHRSIAGLERVFQIGSAVATANHPYLERSGSFIEAEYFAPEKGVRTISLNLRQLLKAALGSVLQKRPQILFKSMSRYFLGSYSEGRAASQFQGLQDHEVWIHSNSGTESSIQKFPGLCIGTSFGDGKINWQISDKNRNSSSYKRNYERQSNRESSDNDKPRSHAPSSSRKEKAQQWKTEVWNFDVEEDETYIAGGFVVHNCHWNCRSECVPLVRQNPNHLKMIEDKSLNAYNHELYPLPKNWSSR